MIPEVDVVVLTRRHGPLRPIVRRGLKRQRGVRVNLHRVIGQALPQDPNRHATIARARNEGKRRGSAPWLMFVDDDVALADGCIAQLVAELRRRPLFAALAAEYLGERRRGEIADHVAMGATLFRREALDHIEFRSDGKRCECQCCCDDLRRLHWGVDYSPAAGARHLPRRRPPHKPPAQDGAESNPGLATTDPGRARSPTLVSGAAVPRIVLVVCYFGPPPPWIRQYLLCCAYNPSINFLIHSDHPDFGPLPGNVQVAPLTAGQFQQRVAQQLGLDVAIKRSYKLCDFKPTYGRLFADRLQGFDYWGYTDLDCVYGDLRRFLSRSRLEQYDVFSARSEYLAGHFTLLRNTPDMRSLYEHSRDYPAVLAAAQNRQFDECGSQWIRRLQGKPLVDGVGCDSMTHVVSRLAADGRLTVNLRPLVEEWPHLSRDDWWQFRWQTGRLWRMDEDREAMYLHFHAFRQAAGFQHPPAGLGDVFDVTPEGFAPPLSKRGSARRLFGMSTAASLA